MRNIHVSKNMPPRVLTAVDAHDSQGHGDFTEVNQAVLKVSFESQ